jgi:hypothetical protein
MNIRINKPLVITVTLVAAGIWAYLFRFSLLPHRKPPKLQHVSIESLQPGHMLPVETDSLRYFVFKPISGDPYVLAVPLIEGQFYLPERYWWKPHTACRDFSLNTINGVVDDRSTFSCRDTGLPDEWQKRWQWNSLGKPIGSHDGGAMDEMYRVNYKRSGDGLTFTSLKTSG